MLPAGDPHAGHAPSGSARRQRAWSPIATAGLVGDDMSVVESPKTVDFISA